MKDKTGIIGIKDRILLLNVDAAAFIDKIVLVLLEQWDIPLAPCTLLCPTQRP